MTPTSLLLPILVPAGAAVLVFLLPRGARVVREILAVAAAIATFAIGVALFGVRSLELRTPWLGSGIDFELRLDRFSAFILVSLAAFLVLVVLYSTSKMRSSPRAKEFQAYLLLTGGLASGAVLADNFVPLLFFWEGLLVTLYAMITVGGRPNSARTATKGLLIGGFCDFCLILGVGLLWSLTGTLTMSRISVAPHGPAAAAFILMVVGAAGKAGAMPFHTWIPDAATDAPVTFMALLPGAFEKLLGIYLLARITLDVFELERGGALSIVLMALGAVTIVLAVLMALIQKDLKRLLAYHAVSQVGYMILGLGTGVPAGIAGGLFHMLNNAVYKSGLFLAAGSVEHRTGTTDLRKLGGLAREMPLTAAGFTLCALAISGIWPLNGFVSKEMVFHGALESGHTIFAVAAWIGAIFTFASFLKAGHSVFFGPRSTEVPEIRENGAPIVLPIVVLGLACLVLGVFNAFPLNTLIGPYVASHAEAGAHLNFSAHALALFTPVALISVGCLVAAFLLHLYGFRKGGNKPYLASEPVHKLPVIHTLYDWAEARVFDAYEQGVKGLRGLSWVLFKGIDRPVDFLFQRVVTATGERFVGLLRKAHNGHYANYLAWCVAGLIIVAGLVGVLAK